MHNDAMYAKEAFDAGASGFVLKHSAPSELITAIHEALKGNTYLSPTITEELMHLYKDKTGVENNVSGNLTQRQRERANPPRRLQKYFMFLQEQLNFISTT
jgi:DNA-binding NarL/FixJ family response regulator